MANPKVRIVSIDKLILDDQNPNKHTKRGRELVEKSLKKYGAGRSVLVDKNNRIIAGNATVEQARAAGIKRIAVIEGDGSILIAHRRGDLDLKKDKAARELSIADNRASELDLGWDAETLAGLKVDLTEFWNEAELRKVLGDFAPAEAEAPEPKLDQAAELQKKWKTARGQIWEIGKHRLMCGDCQQISSLIGDRHFALTLTDPPYGVGWDYESTDDTEGNLEKLIADFLPIVRDISDVVLVTTGNKNQWLYPRPDWTLSWFCAAGIGRGPWGFTCWQPVLAYGGDPYLKRGLGSRPDAAEFQGGKTDFDHPCPKPEGVWKWLLERGSISSEDFVLDTFLGSGTTMAMAQLTGRTCYGMEIEPKYVAVALERLSDMGLKPRLAK